MKPGDWTVRVTDTGKVLTIHRLAAGESITAEVRVDGAGALDFDFGYTPLVNIEGHVWEDANGDKSRDAGEELISDVTVVLVGVDGEVDTAVTDAEGAYTLRATPGVWTTIGRPHRRPSKSP